MLFPEVGGLLASVAVDESPVSEARKEALARLSSNLPGPHRCVCVCVCCSLESSSLTVWCVWCWCRYVAAVYDQHKDLLDGLARREVQTFIQSDAELPTFAKV